MERGLLSRLSSLNADVYLLIGDLAGPPRDDFKMTEEAEAVIFGPRAASVVPGRGSSEDLRLRLVSEQGKRD